MGRRRHYTFQVRGAGMINTDDPIISLSADSPIDRHHKKDSKVLRTNARLQSSGNRRRGSGLGNPGSRLKNLALAVAKTRQAKNFNILIIRSQD